MMKRIISLILLSLSFFSQSSVAAFNQAPEINLPGSSANVILSELKGKVVYLDFWASWCLPCQLSFPWMHDIKRDYAEQGFEIIAVNLDKDKLLAAEFLKEMEVNFEVVYDESGSTASQYKIRGMPSSYLIGRDGRVYASHIGFREEDKVQLEQAIQGLLKR